MAKRWVLVLSRGKRITLTPVVVAPVLLVAGCAFVPSDPLPAHFGAKVVNGVIQVKVPLCPGDKVTRVSVIDADARSSDSPSELWWGTSPKSDAVASGVFHLWSATDFGRSDTTPSTVPQRIEVDYSAPGGDGSGEVFDLTEVRSASLKAGQYWTADGPRTAAQIDARLKCQ